MNPFGRALEPLRAGGERPTLRIELTVSWVEGERVRREDLLSKDELEVCATRSELDPGGLRVPNVQADPAGLRAGPQPAEVASRSAGDRAP